MRPGVLTQNCKRQYAIDRNACILIHEFKLSKISSDMFCLTFWITRKGGYENLRIWSGMRRTPVMQLKF